MSCGLKSFAHVSVKHLLLVTSSNLTYLWMNWQFKSSEK